MTFLHEYFISIKRYEFYSKKYEKDHRTLLAYRLHCKIIKVDHAIRFGPYAYLAGNRLVKRVKCLSLPENGAAVCLKQPGKALHERGLPGTIGADEAEDLSLKNVETDIRECIIIPEPLGEMFNTEQRVQYLNFPFLQLTKGAKKNFS